MRSRIVNRRDLEFQLFEVLDMDSLRERPRFAQHSRETMLAAIDTALAIAEEKFAPPEQKERYLKHLLSGRFFGTMALTEPHAGSSLADILTTATPNPDGTYSLRGTKIFISAGDHDLAENIVHLVLAKIPGSPPGV